MSRPGLFLSGAAAPLFWWLMLAAIFAAGLMRSLPVALVDNDNSPQSRELIQTLEAVPSIDFENFPSPEAAREALAAADVYAMLVVPQEWSAKTDEPDGRIPKNTVVVIDGIQGVHLIVRAREEKTC